MQLTESQSVMQLLSAGAAAGRMSAPSSRLMYVFMASSISPMPMYSSAECERADCPGPSLNEGKGISAWSDSVGEPNGVMPMALHLCIRGLSSLMCDDDRRNERAFSSLFILDDRKLNTSSFL